MKARSMKGKVVNFAVLRERHATDIALGNANMNVRGDVVNARGEVKLSKDQVITAYYANNPKAVKPSRVSLSELTDEVLTPSLTPSQAVEMLPKKPKRVIKDSED